MDNTDNNLAVVDNTQPALPSKPHWVGVDEAVRITGLPRETMLTRIHIGALPHLKIGKRYLVHPPEILELLEKEAEANRIREARAAEIDPEGNMRYMQKEKNKSGRQPNTNLRKQYA